jgi:putative FmdB family regulatory protein
MPIYEYRCNTCGKEFEQLVNRGEETRCKHCGSKDLKKLLSVVGSIRMGSGSSSSSESCCGLTNPCSAPKRCCES